MNYSKSLILRLGLSSDSPGGSAQSGKDGRQGEPPPEWTDVVAKYSDVIYGMALRLTGNDEEARDLAQDVLLRLRKGLKKYKQGNFQGWLYRTTTNAFRDRLRKRKRLREDELPESLPNSPSLAASVETQALQSELHDVVALALVKLPPDFREVIVLRDLQGCSYDEIAEILSIPPGTVRSRIHRGRESLRQLLASYVESES